jgi:hypothetical protein
MNTCDLFDKYRDEELGVAERSDYSSHLVVCAECRAKMSLLDNVVHILKQDAIEPVDQAERIARQAFRQSRSWDTLVVSWLRPGPAFAALALTAVVFSFIWLMPGYRQINILTEYEKLMEEVDAIGLRTSISQTNNDSEFVAWLEQEGNPQ